MTDQLQPIVNWDGLKPGTTENVGGLRTYAGSEAQARAPWRCVSCGEQNVNQALADGCEHCGAGVGAAKHVGIDPPAAKRVKAVPTVADIVHSPVWTPRDIRHAFIDWMTQAGTEVGPLAAFSAGWHAARMTSPVTQEPENERDTRLAADHRTTPTAVLAADQADAPTQESGEAEAGPADAEGSTDVFAGTARERTTLAALIFLREQVYSQQPEEAVSGEWLTPADLDELIATLKGPYA